MKGQVTILKLNEYEASEKALLLCVFLKGNTDVESKLLELENLAKACAIEVVDTVWQNLERKNSKYYVGKGKLEEVKQAISMQDVNVVICNDELSPSQLVTLEAFLECKVIDRTYLILEIFSRRARTNEAKLQVKVAQLTYQLPRLVGLHSSLSRQAGGMNNKGLGETKLELDRRKIRQQMDKANAQLQQLVLQRQVQRKQRKQNDCFTVALIGYTNAGKSSLMNCLLMKSKQNIDKHVLQKDMLFATLETTTRKIHIDNSLPFLLTDTVGFVSDLPTHLIKAFRSTLEEVKEADLLLHVIDASDQNQAFHVETTLKTLKEIGVDDIPIINVYNKIDLGFKLALLPKRDDVLVSCQTNEGIDALLKQINKHIQATLQQVTLIIPFSKGDVLAHLKANFMVVKETYLTDACQVVVKIPKQYLSNYQAYQKSDN